MFSFDEVQTQIDSFLEDYKAQMYEIHQPHEKLAFSDSLFCAEDKVRNRFFWDAILEAMQVQKQRQGRVVVVDAGTGTGILGIFALLAGADCVYFLEQNHHSLMLAKRLLVHMNLSQNAQLVHCDATRYDKLPGMCDLIISETLSAGFVQEDFPFIVANLLKHSHQNTIFLPEGFILEVEEQAENYRKLDIHTIHLDSKNLNINKKISLKHPDTRYLQFTMHAKMFGGMLFRSGTSISFLNPRRRDIKQPHAFFEIEGA